MFFLGPRVFEEVLQVLKEQVSEFAGLKEALGAKKISRLGSQVTVADYSDTFQFAPVAYRHAPESLCWDLERMERFKKSAKQIILSQYIGIGEKSDSIIQSKNSRIGCLSQPTQSTSFKKELKRKF